MRRTECRISAADLAAGIAEGLSYREIAERHRYGPMQLRYDNEVVRRRCIGLGLVTPRPLQNVSGLIPDERILRFSLSVVDVPVARIARSWGVTPVQLTAAAHRLGLPTDPAGRARLRQEMQR